jgi:hypothetical protein
MSNIIHPIAGIGVTGLGGGYFGDDEDGKIKKFTSSECLQALMDKIKDEPELVRNQFNIVTKEQSGEMQQKFWPAIFEASNWTRLSTHRPSEDDEGNKLCGTDREVREYENDFWADERKSLKGKVTTEYGEIIAITVEASW